MKELIKVATAVFNFFVAVLCIDEIAVLLITAFLNRERGRYVRHEQRKSKVQSSHS